MNIKLRNNLFRLLVIFCEIFVVLEECSAGEMKILSRQKRFLAFPPGSSFSAAVCTTIGTIGNPNVNFLSYALNYGISYNLPNETWTRTAANGFQQQQQQNVIKRRFRRHLYKNLEIAINSMGYNGTDCVLKTICETSSYLFGRTGNMIEEIIKTIFSFPMKKLINYEQRYNNVDHRYWNAFELGLQQRHYLQGERNFMDAENVCLRYYPDCSFSLLELAFGKYLIRSRHLLSFT